MKRGLASYAAQGLADAVAWCLYIWVLAQLLPSPDLGRALYALLFSGCLAALLTAGWKAWLLRPAPPQPADTSEDWSAAVAGIAMRALVALPVMILVSGQVGGMLLSPLPDMPVMIAVLAGLFSLLRLAGFALHAREEVARAAILRGPLPVLMALGAVLLTDRMRPLTVDLVLGLHGICLLVALVLALRRLPRMRWCGDLPGAPVFAASVAQTGNILFRNADILVIGLVLSPVEAAIYLIARGVAMWLQLLFRVLGQALQAPMAYSFASNAGPVFVSQAARANLGFLLIGGAGALLLFLAVDPVLRIFGIPAVQGRQVLVWLIVAGAAPAVFGATQMFMSVMSLQGLRGWVVWPALPLALILSYLAAREGIASLAMVHAALQIGAAAACAGIVALRCGIWPGLTAMFHHRIRLR